MNQYRKLREMFLEDNYRSVFNNNTGFLSRIIPIVHEINEMQESSLNKSTHELESVCDSKQIKRKEEEIEALFNKIRGLLERELHVHLRALNLRFKLEERAFFQVSKKAKSTFENELRKNVPEEELVAIAFNNRQNYGFLSALVDVYDCDFTKQLRRKLNFYYLSSMHTRENIFKKTREVFRGNYIDPKDLYADVDCLIDQLELVEEGIQDFLIEKYSLIDKKVRY